MARIRTIKPEFWTDEKVLGIKPMARLLFIGMWNFADDYGRMEYSPVSLKAKIFPCDSMSVDEVRDMISELDGSGLLSVYTVSGKEFIEIKGWHNQKIDKRQSSKIPGPPDDDGVVLESPPAPADYRRPTQISSPVMEGNGKESNSVANATVADATPDDPAIPEREYFFRGREVLGQGAGGLIADLLKAKGRNVALARAALETASTKQNPKEYVAAICRGGKNGKSANGNRSDTASGRAASREAEFIAALGRGAMRVLEDRKSTGPNWEIPDGSGPPELFDANERAKTAH